jgi:hypothetical protein
MKTFAISAAVAALIGSTSAIAIRAAPDVYGPNGENYKNDSADYEMSRIGINITKKGDDKHCRVGDWTTVHYVAKLKDGRIVSDTRAEPGNMPVTFALGAHETFRCFDNAITQLHNGDKAELSCPSFQAWGDAYTQAPLGGEPIPLGSDIDFEIEVVECNRTPTRVSQVNQPITTTMQPAKCMYLHFSQGEEHTGNDLILTSTEYEYKKGSKQVYLDHKLTDDTTQQWFWNEATGVFTNAASPKWSVGIDSATQELIVTDAKTPMKWFYNSEDSIMKTDTQDGGFDIVAWGSPKPWTGVQVATHGTSWNTEGCSSKLRIEYCHEHSSKSG